jgi:hypothetical protein
MQWGTSLRQTLSNLMLVVPVTRVISIHSQGSMLVVGARSRVRPDLNLMPLPLLGKALLTEGQIINLTLRKTSTGCSSKPFQIRLVVLVPISVVKSGKRRGWSRKLFKNSLKTSNLSIKLIRDKHLKSRLVSHQNPRKRQREKKLWNSRRMCQSLKLSRNLITYNKQLRWLMRMKIN